MANYFRITVYHPQKDICAVFDSNGRFEKLWQFSAFLVGKGFKIAEVGPEDKFLDGDLPKPEESSDKILLRACAKGSPVRDGNRIEINGKSYEVNR